MDRLRRQSFVALVMCLPTQLMAVVFIFCDQLPHTVAAIVTLLADFWIRSVLFVLSGAPSPFCNYREFRRFVRRLHECGLWWYTAMIISLGFVGTIFFPDVMRLIARSYMVPTYGRLYVLSFMLSQISGPPNMIQISVWSSKFSKLHMLLRSLSTMDAVRNYLLTFAAIVWCCYLFLSFRRAPSNISSFKEYRRLVIGLPEFHFWLSTTMALSVAFVTTFFMPNKEVVLAILSYIVGFFFWLLYLALETFL